MILSSPVDMSLQLDAKRRGVVNCKHFFLQTNPTCHTVTQNNTTLELSPTYSNQI
jgi:hypothetical protein